MPTLEPDDARERFAAARVARLATVSGEGVPHLVPVVFAVVDDRVLVAIDGKPKRTRSLRRLANITENPAVCLLADEYAEDWSGLWWVRVDGRAAVRDDDAALAEARAALGARYPQHVADPPEGPVIEVTVTRWSGWSAS
ncbi:TIGR03668 family PPOX class F420-dependent oxidoreductase [Actinomycetospora sp. TBRC 11914]|uniref:TIGR03668 family PPOX class F420-dependent oxidoreductase n=1 Tax=Actinomycetospora sp. TBRC 11914 TaxID=2729387 RepID=UPI00145EBAD6|nr:TIGR03668 family PPOX class F420-dependent oxidoreductase [Actinomycetospora sp. TBRC 11914]NMO91093.1 TIGR03668 family PPOX class F420-dependent oxidoreductase [Actinomycetospora sp. TBRC 11914]